MTRITDAIADGGVSYLTFIRHKNVRKFLKSKPGLSEIKPQSIWGIEKRMPIPATKSSAKILATIIP